METNEMSETLAHTIRAVDHWTQESADLVPHPPAAVTEYREAFRKWDAAIVANRAVKEQAHRLAAKEVSEDPDIREMFLGFSPTALLRPVSLPRVLAAYEEVDRQYQATLPTVGYGGLVNVMMLDVTRTALKSWLDTLQ